VMDACEQTGVANYMGFNFQNEIIVSTASNKISGFGSG